MISMNAGPLRVIVPMAQPVQRRFRSECLAVHRESLSDLWDTARLVVANLPSWYIAYSCVPNMIK